VLDDEALLSLLSSLRTACGSGQVVFLPKASGELLKMGWSGQQALNVLSQLVDDDYDRTEWSTFHGGVDLHTFMPPSDDSPDDLFIRIYEHDGFVCVSFHWA